MDTPSEPFQSQYPALCLPPGGFQSTLPAHLLAGADEQTKWLLNEISRNSAATEFACKGAVDLSNHLRTLNGKTFSNQKAAIELHSEVSVLRTDIDTLKLQMAKVTPFASTLATVKVVFSNKAFLFVLLLNLLFLLGYSRDAILKFFIGG